MTAYLPLPLMFLDFLDFLGGFGLLGRLRSLEDETAVRCQSPREPWFAVMVQIRSGVANLYSRGARAMPRMLGRTKGSAFRMLSRVSRSTSKPAARSVSPVRRVK